MKTAVVILNWNTKAYLEQFLPPLLESVKELDACVVVADNASSDGSVDMLEKKFPQVQRIVLKDNYGFTGGYNRALEEVDAEYFVLLNSDIEVSAGWLSPLVEWMDSHAECGICAPKLLSYFDHGQFEYAGAAGGRIDVLGYPFCRGRVMKKVEKDHGQYDAPTRVFWATGACLMIRRELWERFGGLDNRFFAHMEEIDLCWRLQLEGYSVNVVPQSTVFHLGGGTLPNDSPWKLKLNFRNNLLMLQKNLPKTYIAAGSDVHAAVRKTRLVLAFRRLLDLASGLMYIASGKKELFKSVLEAHKEFKTMGRKPDIAKLEAWKQDGAQKASLRGIYPGSMVLAYYLKGGAVFTHLDAAVCEADKKRSEK